MGGNPSGGGIEYQQARGKVKQWIHSAPEQGFDDIVGNQKALSQLKDALTAPMLFKKLYEEYGMVAPKGAVLYGPPGCGKTMFARAAACELKKLYKKDVEFILLGAMELQSKYFGETEQRIRDIFNFARLYKAKHGHPLLIFIDEAETFLPDRTGKARHVYPFEESQVATFLSEMDGIQESGAFVLLATNRPEALDEALLRDGRCDFKIRINRPDQEAMEIILQKVLKDIPRNGPLEDLVFAAVESFLDPHKVLMEASLMGVNLEKEKIVQLKGRHFLFEHIISGAMLVSIAERSKRIAFARDKETGVFSGVSAHDVATAVNLLWEENRNLGHSYALDEFRSSYIEEAREEYKRLNED